MAVIYLLKRDLAMLLQRVAPDRYLSEEPGGRGGFAGHPGSMSARQALEMATRGGAAVLGRDDVGYLAPGMSADFIVAINLNQIGFAGALTRSCRCRGHVMPAGGCGLVCDQRPCYRRAR